MVTSTVALFAALVPASVALAAGTYAEDPAADVRHRDADTGEYSEVDRPSVDVRNWGVTHMEDIGGSTLATFELRLGAPPEADGEYRLLIDAEEPARGKWWIRPNADGAEIWRQDPEGGYWKYGCPTMQGGWDGAVAQVTIDTACMGAPDSFTVHPWALYGEQGVGSWRDWNETPVAVDFPGSGRRLPPAPLADTDSACAGAPSGGFEDTHSNTHEAAIDCVAHLGIALGKGDGRYAPKEGLRRGQLATFVLRTLDAAGIATPDEGDTGDVYPDDEGHPHEHSLNALTSMGLLYRESGLAQPDEFVDRAEMAEFLASSLWGTKAQPFATEPDYFGDDDHLAGPPEFRINAIATAGVSGGKGNGLYAPGEQLLRDAMASFLARLYVVLGDAPESTSTYGWWKH